LRRRTSTIPIVIVNVTDPVGQGFVESLARPGGNITGFTDYDPPMAGNGLADPDYPARRARGGPVQSRDRALCRYDGTRHRGIGPILSRRGAGRAVSRQCRIEAMMAGLAREERGGLLILPENFNIVHYDAIITLAARYRLPAVNPYRFFTESGGLMSYGIDPYDLFRRAASYVDRILKGAKPADFSCPEPKQI
jgi:putative ABC transport system substrate-binding protein